MFFRSWNFSRLAVLLPLLFMTTVLGQSSSRKAPGTARPQSKKPEMVTLTIDMDDSKLASIRQTGYLRASIPAAYRGRVDAVRLKRPVSFKKDAFRLDKSVDKLNDTVTVTINQTLLDQLDYQPVIAKVYYSDFANVLVVYQRRRPGDPVGLAERENKPTAADSPRFYARVDDQRGLYGWMEGLAKIKLKSDFGDVVINSTEIAGIKFNANNSGSVAIRLNSGASVSGYVDFDEINMKCSWGTQKLSLAEIDSIVLDRKFRFAADPHHPGRWSFEQDIVTPPTTIFNDSVPGFATPIPVRSLPYNP